MGRLRTPLFGVAASTLLLLVAALPSELAAEAADGSPRAWHDELELPRLLPLGIVALRSPQPSLVFVPRSRFVMGSTPNDVIDAAVECGPGAFGERCKDTVFANEMPQHRVVLSAFWLDRTEVTVRDYDRCVKLGRCRPVPFDEGGRRFDHPTYPVSLVTWDDARDYCHYRGARLPTEAEFERAARGVTGRRYPWGNYYNSHAANHGRLGVANTDAGDGFEDLAPIGSFPAGRTSDGFLDLAGNVAEWVHDRYFPSYPAGDAVDPRGPNQAGAAGSARVVRGGHFATAAPWLRGAARVAAEPSVRRPFIGFRCARSATAPPTVSPDRDERD